MAGLEVIGALEAVGQFMEISAKTMVLAKAVYDHVKDGPQEIQQQMAQLEILSHISERIRNTTSCKPLKPRQSCFDAPAKFKTALPPAKH
ncbi:Fc.00g081510.m01.CDS01 [Cosmosporella sp. VM-42]